MTDKTTTSAGAGRGKPQPMEPYSPQWQQMAYKLLRDFAPPLKPCQHCNGPVISGYCCGRCGSDEP